MLCKLSKVFLQLIYIINYCFCRMARSGSQQMNLGAIIFSPIQISKSFLGILTVPSSAVFSSISVQMVVLISPRHFFLFFCHCSKGVYKYFIKLPQACYLMFQIFIPFLLLLLFLNYLDTTILTFQQLVVVVVVIISQC